MKAKKISHICLDSKIGSRQAGPYRQLEYASKVLRQKVTAGVELTEEELEQARQERRRMKMWGRTPKYWTMRSMRRCMSSARAATDAGIFITGSAPKLLSGELAPF